MSRQEIEGLLRPPEFEQRCDNFVRSVENQIVDEYRYFWICAENETRKSLDIRSNVYNTFKKFGLEHHLSDKSLELYSLREHQAEVTSAFANFGRVEIIAYQNNQQAIDTIYQIIQQIEELAQKNKGERSRPTDQEIKQGLHQDLKDPESLPGALLVYRFT